MRLDYVLYGVAIIFFIVAVGILVSVSEQNGGLIYGSIAAIVGLILIGCGYFLKPVVPKPASQPQITPTIPQIPKPEQQPAVAAEAVKNEVMIEEAKSTEVIPKVETPIAEVSNMQHTIVAQESQTTQIPTPEAPKLAPEPEIANASEECTVDTTTSGLAQIKCISAKRAEQLNANGIKTVQDLANASSSELAAKLQVSEKIVKMWIGTAKKLVK